MSDKFKAQDLIVLEDFGDRVFKIDCTNLYVFHATTVDTPKKHAIVLIEEFDKVKWVGRDG